MSAPPKQVRSHGSRGAQAADLPVKKAVPIEYVRVCTAYGAGFFYIPGTDTCLRVSGRARAEYGYIGSDNRRVVGGGDLSGFPNGRRPADDVVDASLRVAMGEPGRDAHS